jgi:hypothetical protein
VTDGRPRGDVPTTAEQRTRLYPYSALLCTLRSDELRTGSDHRVPTLLLLPLHVVEAGINHLNKEITPLLPTGKAGD